MKKINPKFFLVLGAATLLGTATSCKDDDNAEAPKTEMRVMSFNIRYNKSSDAYPWPVRREPVAAMIDSVQPDIIGFQEPDEGQLADLKEDNPGYDFVAIDPQAESLTWAQTGSIMIAYKRDRFSVKQQGHFWHSVTPDEASPCWAATDGKVRTTVWALFHDNKSGKDLYVFDAQLSTQNGAADKTARTNAANLNLKRMQEIAGRHNPVLFMGDFNASAASNDDRKECVDLFYEWMWGARDKSPVTDTKFSFNSFGSRALTVKDNLDHIFYRHVTPLEFCTIDEHKPFGVDYLSRHNPIVFTFEY